MITELLIPDNSEVYIITYSRVKSITEKTDLVSIILSKKKSKLPSSLKYAD